MASPTRPALCRYVSLSRGFTVLELLTTVSVLSIVLGTAVPAYQGIVHKNRMTTHINTFITHMHLSRSEAVKRGDNVVICRTADGESCGRSSGWHEGWLVFADRNHNREIDAGETLLAVSGAWQDPITVTSGQRRKIVYQPNGFSPGSNATYVFCDPAYPGTAKAVILSNTGRPRLSDTRPDGTKLACGDNQG